MNPVATLDAASRDLAGPATLPATTLAAPRRTRAADTPPTPPRVEEIVAVIRRAESARQGCGFEGWQSCSGGPAFGSARPWHYRRVT